MQGLTTTVNRPLSEVDPVVRQALSEQGFGVLTEIDVAATLRAKLGVERTGLVILGACNPNFAHQALQQDPTVAMLLPCNVVLEEVDGGTRVSMADPRQLMPDPGFAELAAEATDRLIAALATVKAAV
ncbi:MAG: DUF302 domain-containing protein [Actinomycetota bacterium]|jgi:uncharacterized protein (DUF302 family)|nr:DUF302 domain-containing protein [Actinomycetota bacterium]MDA8294190.1 DUF302 domain-containing protein [Actinomycetota bacterium]